MVGVIYATRCEADPFLLKTCARPLTDQPLMTFQTDAETYGPCITVISGMGKVAAAMAATHLVVAHQVSMLISAGLCGRLDMNNRWSVGDLYRIDSAIEGDCDRFGQAEQTVTCDARWFSQLKPARLVTNDRPVFNAAWRSRLAGIGEVADMEGAAVARVAKLYGIRCAMIKGISDSADESGRRDVASHMDWVSGRIADELIHELMQKKTDKQP